MVVSSLYLRCVETAIEANLKGMLNKILLSMVEVVHVVGSLLYYTPGTLNNILFYSIDVW